MKVEPVRELRVYRVDGRVRAASWAGGRVSSRILPRLSDPKTQVFSRLSGTLPFTFI